jgi:hypothetical protein
MGAGRISLTAAHQRRGQCNGRLGPVPAARVVPTDAAAPRPPASAARRGASAWGPGGRPRRLSIIAMTWPFVAMLTGDRRPTPPRVVSTDVSDLLRWRASAPGEERSVAPEGAPPSLARRHPTLKKRDRGMDIIPLGPKFARQAFTAHGGRATRGRIPSLKSCVNCRGVDFSVDVVLGCT